MREGSDIISEDGWWQLPLIRSNATGGYEVMPLT